MEGGVEGTRSIDAPVEEQAEMGGVLAVAEVVGDQTSGGVGLGVAKGLFHALSVGLKHLGQHQSLLLLFIFIFIFILLEDVNLRPNLTVGIALDGEGVLAGESGQG